MKLLKTIAFITLFWSVNAQPVTIYLNVSGGSYATEKWVNITTGSNGTGTVIWAQGNGTIGNSAGFLTNQAITLACGTTFYLNAYDKYADGWDGTKYTLRTATGTGGTLIINNSNNSPNDGTDTDASSNWDGTAAELEKSEAFTVACPCTPSLGTASAIVTNCLSNLFAVSLTINSAGPGATSVVVSDGGINPNQTVTSFPSTVTFSSYTAGSSVTLNVNNGTCNINANTVTENCPIGFSCALAQPIVDGFTTSSTIITPGTDGVENWVTSAVATCGAASNAGFVNSDVKIFSYTTGSVAGESFYFTINHNSATDGEHSIGVFSSCVNGALSGCIASTYKFHDVVGVCAKSLAANTTYYIAVAKEYYSIDGENLKFDVIDFTVETTTTIPSDECNTSALINIAQPYQGSTRCTYTASTSSPSGCGSIENDSWMKFTASATTAQIEYNVFNCTNGDGVQLAVYSGTCGSLSQITGSCVNYASNNATGIWTLSGLTANQTYYIRTDGYAGDLCSYSFSAISGVIILPIELQEFEVLKLNREFNKLTWNTASESNSDYFIVQKSIDGINFQNLETLKAAGNSSSNIAYQSIDKDNSLNTTYYRLKMVNMNGSYSYSLIQSVDKSQMEDLVVFPNPSNGEINLSIPSRYKNSELIIHDFQGKAILNFAITEISENIKLDFSNLETGIYFVQINGEHAGKFTILK